MLTIPAGLVFLVGSLLDEPYMPNFAYRQVIFTPVKSLILLSSRSNIWLDSGKPEVSRCCQGYVDNTEMPRRLEAMLIYVLIHCIELGYP